MTRHEKNLVRRAEKFCRASEYRHDQTRQRRFERTFLSLDRPDENGNLFDYGDCGWAMRQMLRTIDAPIVERIRDLRFAAARKKLAGYPVLRETLTAIRRFRSRKRIVAALGIPAGTYAKRFTRICRILGITA